MLIFSCFLISSMPLCGGNLIFCIVPKRDSYASTYNLPHQCWNDEARHVLLQSSTLRGNVTIEHAKSIVNNNLQMQLHSIMWKFTCTGSGAQLAQFSRQFMLLKQRGRGTRIWVIGLWIILSANQSKKMRPPTLAWKSILNFGAIVYWWCDASNFVWGW